MSDLLGFVVLDGRGGGVDLLGEGGIYCDVRAVVVCIEEDGKL